MSTRDALTVRRSKPELWVAYHRKILVALAPVLLAGFVVIQDAATAGEPMRAVTLVTAVLAVGQALGTYVPDNAVAKLISSGLFAISSGVIAAATDGLSMATALMVLTQALAWIGAGVVENGARPDVVLGQVVGINDRPRPLPEQVALHKDDARPVRQFVLWMTLCAVGHGLAIAAIWQQAQAWR